MMAWDPDVYNKFKKERYAPFEDLLALVKIQPGMQVIDLGCGTGELTKKLADHLPSSTVLGIDLSAEMLTEAATFAGGKLTFEQVGIEEKITSGKKWDLVFSHAAIQWLDNHEILLPKIIAAVNTGGQVAIQLPSNHDHITHIMLHEMALAEPYKKALGGWTRNISTLSIEAYARILFDHGSRDITVFEKAYPHVLKDAAALYDWMSGTAMIRYTERLPAGLQQSFKEDYKKQLEKVFTGSPVFYPFKRIIMAASF